MSTAAELKSLLAPASTELSVQRATDSLNAQFTSIDDLDHLDTMAPEAQSRKEELNRELSSSKAALRQYLNQTRDVAAGLLNTAKELSLERHTLADELSELSRNLVSVLTDGEPQSTLLEDLQTLHRNLKELESVRHYVLIIRHTLQLREAALEQLRTVQSISFKALDQYSELLQFVSRVSAALGSVEDGSGKQKLHLVKFLEEMRDKTWRDMKAQLASSLLEEAEKIGWPMAVEYAACDKDIRLSFERAFVKLLQLRQVKIKLHEKHSLEDTEGGGLYPIEALVHPIALRFKYHFDGTRQTNRLDKPEWYFTHILNIAHEHRHFMNTAIQHILAASGLKHISAWREFAYLLLPILSKKLKKTIPMLLSRPSLFAHTIHQAVIFDAAYVEEGFQLQGTSAQSEGDPDATWEGISTVILSNYEWFNAWLQAERNFVEGQYNEIISAQDAWTVSDDSEEEANAWDLKPTNSARRVKALFNQITDRFSPLPSPVQRTQFLVSIQLTLLESYHSRISSSLDAFETLSNAFLRAVPGALALSLGNREEGSVNVDAQNLTTGVAGVQRLCKALISATYIRAAIEAWSEDTFFLELWQDISNDPPLRHYVEQSVSLPNLDPENSGDEVTCGTIFDEVVSKYQSLIARTETMVVQQVCGEIEGGLRAHFVASTSIAAGEPSDGIGISQTLLGPLALLSSDLTFLAASLPQHILTNLYRRIASRLSEHILHRQILYRGSFSRQEGASLQAECELWVDTCHTALGGKLGGGRQRVEAPWSTLLQAGRLVGSSGEPWETITNATFGTQDEVEWEQVMLDVTGVSELSREDVSKLLRRRND